MTDRLRAPAIALRPALLVAGALAMVLGLVAVPLVAAVAQGRLVLDSHHSDAFSVRYVDGSLVLATRADLPSGSGQVLDPDEVLFHVTDALKVTLPASPDYAFLGEPGATAWRIPQTFQPGVLWAGWETESLPRGVFERDRVQLRAESITGPGRVELYVNDVDGPVRMLSSTDPSLRRITEAVGAHTHANWVFTEPGDYVFTMVAEATLVGGQTLTTAVQDYHFRVGPAGTDGSASPTTSQPSPSGTAEPSPSPSKSTKKPKATKKPKSTEKPNATETPTPSDSDAPRTGTSAAPRAEQRCELVPIETIVTPDDVDVVTEGHFDFGPVLAGGALSALVKDDRSSPPTWIDPSALVLHLTDEAQVTPRGSDFDFLGDGPVWQIPLTQRSGVPWLGWNTQHESVAGQVTGQATLSLEQVEGPGGLAVYSVDSWGQLEHRYFGTIGSFPRSTKVDVGAAGVHVHGIWAFTQSGAYHVTLKYSMTLGGAQRDATAVLTFFAGDGDPRSAIREVKVVEYEYRTPDGEPCEPGDEDDGLAATGADDTTTREAVGFAGTLVVVGLALVVAAALAPRPRRTAAGA